LSIETEVKIEIGDPEDFCRRLNVLNPSLKSGRHFEDNHLLDFAEGTLKAGKRLLRVRFARNSALLTYKGPASDNGIFKTREELETQIEDGAVALQIFEQIGMRLWFRYQKYRQEFLVEGVSVAVDETPVGNYAEFEGSEEGIRNLARKMGIDESRFLRSSYYSIYLEYCRKNGQVPDYMIFNKQDSN
jgi:adenylate cyclase, class 2